MGAVPRDDRGPPRPAPLARRLAAGLLDATPLYAAVAYAVARGEVRIVSGLTYPTGYSAYIILGGGVLAYLLLTFICEWKWQKTPGKYVFGLRLTTVTGTRPSARAIFIRNLLRLLDLQPITLLIVPLTTLRQRLGDFLAATMVVDDADPYGTGADRPQDRRGSADQ